MYVPHQNINRKRKLQTKLRFTDAWKQASVSLGTEVDLEKRMSWSYRRAVKAMLVTSFTTAVAFFSTAGSPVMPISTLEIWAGMLVIFQFILVITIYPSALVIWQRSLRNRDLFSILFSRNERKRKIHQHRLERFCFSQKRTSEGELRLIEKVFNGPWTEFTFRAKWPLLVLSIALISVSTWLATKLDTPDTVEKFLPRKHPIQVATDTVRSLMLLFIAQAND